MSKTLRVVLLGTVLCGAGLFAAPLVVLEHTATFNSSTGSPSLSLLFNRVPNLGPGEGFQYYFLGDLTLGYPAKYDSIVRCCEQAGILVVRDPIPATPDAGSGGWGPIRVQFLSPLMEPHCRSPHL